MEGQSALPQSQPSTIQPQSPPSPSLPPSPPTPRRTRRDDSPPAIPPGSPVMVSREDGDVLGHVVSLGDDGIYTVDICGVVSIASDRNVRPARFRPEGNKIFFRAIIDCEGEAADLLCVGTSRNSMTVISSHPVFQGCLLCKDDCEQVLIHHIVAVEEEAEVEKCRSKRAVALGKIAELVGEIRASEEEAAATKAAIEAVKLRPKWRTEPADKRTENAAARLAAANAARIENAAAKRKSAGSGTGFLFADEADEASGAGETGDELASISPAGQPEEVTATLAESQLQQPPQPPQEPSTLERQVAILRDATEKIHRAKWGDFTWVDLPV